VVLCKANRLSYKVQLFTTDMRKPTLQAIQKQIERLQQQASKVRDQEVGEVVRKIRAAIAHYQLTVEEVFGGRKRGRPAGKTAAKKQVAPKKTIGSKKRTGRKIAIKYRDGSGNTWTGRGSQPRWLVAALKDGKRIEDFVVKR